jgi:hypothetical protein
MVSMVTNTKRGVRFVQLERAGLWLSSTSIFGRETSTFKFERVSRRDASKFERGFRRGSSKKVSVLSWSSWLEKGESLSCGEG